MAILYEQEIPELQPLAGGDPPVICDWQGRKALHLSGDMSSFFVIPELALSTGWIEVDLGADGTAYFWDVTDPGNIIRVDSIQVDARTVNDVKVSEDGRVCIISREGASSRKNGIVILDVANPRDVKVISTFTENLTGGVHILLAPDMQCQIHW